MVICKSSSSSVKSASVGDSVLRILCRKIKSFFRVARHQWARWYGPRRMRWLGGWYNGEDIVAYRPPQEGNARLKKKILQSQPFMAARYGTYELMAVAHSKYKYQGTDVLRRLCFNAGFFPSEDVLLDRFANVYTEATKNIDLFCAWNYRHGLWKYEEAVFREHCPDAILTDIRAIKFLRHEEPWTMALRDMKVLVIHPFADTIRRQYQKRELLFPDGNVLPTFELLKTLRAVQSAAGNEVAFESWFEALDHMKSEMEQIDFDVALIGAGAYGLPLAAHAKMLGKQGIHMGGVTQLLFGIMGNRWEKSYGHLFNKHWARPSERETPPKAEAVEGGAYW